MEFLGILAYLVSFLIMASIYAVFSLGLNLQWGYTGLFNIGVAGFFAIGSYTSALVTMPEPTGLHAEYVQQLFALDLPFPVGLLCAAVVCGLVALLIGIPTLKLGDDYLAIATIGIAESIRIIFQNESWLANGTRGLVGLTQPLNSLVAPRDYNFVYLVIVLCVLLLVFLIVERSVRSPWGRVLRAVRDDEHAAAMSGKNVYSYKLQALVAGSMVMGVGGALFAHYTKVVTPDIFTPLHGTFIVWVMVMAGGSGNNKGVVAGAFLVWAIWIGTQFITDILIPATFRSRAPYIRFLLIGVLLEIVLLRRPQGIVREEKRISRYLSRIYPKS